MSKLKGVVDSLDDIEEAQRGLYVEQKDKDGNATGKFILDVSDMEGHDAVRALSNAYSAEKKKRTTKDTELTQLKEKFKKFADLPDDFDVDHALELLAAEGEDDDDDEGAGKKKKKPEGNGEKLKTQYEAKITNLTNKHANELKERDDKIAALNGAINKLIIDDGLTKALVEVGVKKEFMKAAAALLRSQVTVKEDEGEYSAVVETQDGGPVALADFVKGWAETEDGKAFLIPAEGAGAGGGKKPGGGSNVPNPWKQGQRNLTEQARLLKENPKLAERFKKEAGVPV